MTVRPILVTRAEPGATRTCDALAAAGYAPLNAATARIAMFDTPLALDTISAFAVTSRNGAAGLARLSVDRTRPVFAVGAATAADLVETGFASVRHANGTVGALAALIARHAPGGTLLHVRGAHQAGDLVAALQANGLTAYDQVIYQAQPVDALSGPIWSALNMGAAVLIHSAMGAERLLELARKAGQHKALTRAPIIAISSAAAAPLRAAGARDVSIAGHPGQSGLMAALEKRMR